MATCLINHMILLVKTILFPQSPQFGGGLLYDNEEEGDEYYAYGFGGRRLAAPKGHRGFGGGSGNNARDERGEAVWSWQQTRARQFS